MTTYRTLRQGEIIPPNAEFLCLGKWIKTYCAGLLPPSGVEYRVPIEAPEAHDAAGEGCSGATCYASFLARRFHDAYERLAPQFGYDTRPDTKVYDPDTPNGRLMAAVCVEVMTEFTKQLREIAEMPEYDQDDAHRLRHKARKFLQHNA